jgi:uncharacterized protein DUF2589
MAEEPPVSSDAPDHPIESLIGAPLKAAVGAEIFSVKATSDFINAVGFNPPVLDEAGNVVTPATVRNVNFEFDRINQDPKTGKVYSETVSVQLPLLAAVNIPSIQVQQMDVAFDVEVTQVVPPATEAAPEITWPGPGSEIQVRGKVTTPADHIRSTDYAPRYHIELHAAHSGPSEALSRVIDLMAHSVAPSPKPQVVEQQGAPPGPGTPPGEPA